jgi:exopolysaccharide biosynthesis polyprenyl glycosylphosphotransferase
MAANESLPLPLRADPVAPTEPLRRVGRESPLQTAGLAGLAYTCWVAAAGSSDYALALGLPLTVVTLACYTVVLRDRAEFSAAWTVRLVRHLEAATLATLGALALASFLPVPLDAGRMALGGAVIFAAALAFDLLVLQARALRQPVRLVGVGVGEAAGRLARDFAAAEPSGLELVGFISVDPQGPEHVRAVDARPVLGSLDTLAQVLERQQVHALVLTEPAGRLEVMARVLDVPGGPPAVLELSEVYERGFGRVPVEEINAAWFMRTLALSHARAPWAPRRVAELAISWLLVVLALPLMLAIALAVRLDSPGPVLYRQRRVGARGRTFMMLKFRSMRSDAESDGEARWAEAGDARVTRVGRMLRRFRLDELPQLWNVVRGDMALVGPRPERPELVARIAAEVPFYQPRHFVRPGITGWAQVYAPYAASVDETAQKLSYDLYYLKHSSLTTDLGIMLRTASVMAAGRGAR